VTGGRRPDARSSFALRVVAAGAVIAVTLLGLVALDPLGTLRGPFLLVTALPVMAHALAVTGWVRVASSPFARIRPGVPVSLATYLAWLVVSALLTLDVAAVVAVPVGLAVAQQHGRGGRPQVAGAVIGANVGSLVFPFSNLTNLVLVAGTGLHFATYVAAAWLPQIAAAVGAGLVLVYRSRVLDDEEAADPADAPDLRAPSDDPLGPLGALAGVVAAGGAIGAVVVGFAGGDVAAVLAIASAVITAAALLDGRLTVPAIRHALSIPAIVVILAAAVLRDPIAGLSGLLPVPDPAMIGWLAFPAAAIVGGLLSSVFNNLPAAAFGAIWLQGAGAPLVVAYLVGTNVLALITPHGSVATMLGRTLAHRGGVTIGPRDYLGQAWRYALAGAIPALAVLAIVR
jgi:arsenical pump membrane protein